MFYIRQRFLYENLRYFGRLLQTLFPEKEGSLLKLLIKLLAVFSVVYAVSALMSRARVKPPFAFLSTALISLLGTVGDRVLMPKMNRTTAAATDSLLIAASLLGANKLSGGGSRVPWPYIGAVSTILGGFEALYHEWIYNRGRYQDAAKQDEEGRIIH